MGWKRGRRMGSRVLGDGALDEERGGRGGLGVDDAGVQCGVRGAADVVTAGVRGGVDNRRGSVLGR